MAYHIKKVSGADISVTNEMVSDSLPIIIAAPDTMPGLEELFPEELAWLRTLSEETEDGVRNWGDDGFAIRTYEGKIYIFGANSKGALNGTYDFIEENMGVLWVRADEEIGLVYENIPTVLVAKTDYKEKSPFQIRGWHLSARSDQDNMLDMFARNKLNSRSWGTNEAAEERGISSLRVSHNIKKMVVGSPAYDPDEREYWNTTKGGDYLFPDQSQQINFWSDKAAEVLAASVIAYVRDGIVSPGVAGFDNAVFIGIEDNGNGYNAPYDSQPYEYAPGEFVDPSDKQFISTVYFSFFNKVARMVAEECPGAKVITFAYNFAEKAPKCELEENLWVVLAPASEDLSTSLFDSSSSLNKNIYLRIEEWKQITDNLVFYNYYGCYLPADQYTRPIWDRIKGDLQYYADSGFLGVQPEGVASDDDNMYWFDRSYTAGGETDVPNSAAWDMNCLTYWIFSKLCWNPYEDVDALIDEFCTKYYGAAAEYMKEYYYLIEKGFEDGRPDLMMQFQWDTSWEAYEEAFLFNPNFDEPIHEKILEALNNAWEAGDGKVKARIRSMKEIFENAVHEWFEQ